ncbi:hypothetical protein OKW49_008068 [Paraburkholderia youngii]|uniref:hypothetical protein n=1 Tax=Paraburkholderia youngii TaxID=2782701 RepID=UPI003D1BA293
MAHCDLGNRERAQPCFFEPIDIVSAPDGLRVDEPDNFGATIGVMLIGTEFIL